MDDGTRLEGTLAPYRDGCPEHADRRIGRLVAGKYRLKQRIGSGGMGVVYEAEHSVLGRRFAIKYLHDHFAAGQRMLSRFLREARAAGCLQSDNILGALDFGRDEGVPYLVMDLYPGEDLGSYLKSRGALDPTEAASLGLDICRGLAAAHEAQLVHRDLKPANVFVATRCGGQPVAKILDFGVAKLLHGADQSEDGALVGTLGYMAPEQITGSRAVDERADLYALGVLLYQTLSGRLPHSGQRAELVFEVLSSDPAPLRTLRPEVPIELAQLVHRLLARDPAERPTSASCVAAALIPFAGNSSWPTNDTTRSSPGPLPPPLPPEPLESAKTELMPPVAPRDMSRSALLMSIGALTLSVVAVATMFGFVYSQGHSALRAAPSPARTISSLQASSPGPPQRSTRPAAHRPESAPDAACEHGVAHSCESP